MSTVPVPQVKWLAFVLFREQAMLEAVLPRLAERFSGVDFRGACHLFDCTDYYEKEMGAPLRRVLVSFTELAAPDRLVQAKRFAAAVEQDFSAGGRRRVNIDPGYLDLFKLVLASFKGWGNKIHLGGEVWADLALHYRKNAFHPFDWGFPDLRAGVYNDDLLQVRRLYKAGLARNGARGPGV